jgi:uncharacterized membrane protein YagU involved in acid resistance
MATLLRGGLAGTIATAPMTLVMYLLWLMLSRRQRYYLPPRLITKNLLNQLNLDRSTSREQVTWLTWLLHFGYGGAMGTIFAPLAGWRRLPAVPLGALYGIMVWIGSYKGLLPAVDLIRDADTQPDERNALMIAAHLVWGAATGFVLAVLTRRSGNAG